MKHGSINFTIKSSNHIVIIPKKKIAMISQLNSKRSDIGVTKVGKCITASSSTNKTHLKKSFHLLVLI